MWYLYGYDKGGQRSVIGTGAMQSEIYALMFAADVKAAAVLAGVVAWEMKQEGPFNV